MASESFGVLVQEVPVQPVEGIVRLMRIPTLGHSRNRPVLEVDPRSALERAERSHLRQRGAA